jgi:hypothetical protein
MMGRLTLDDLKRKYGTEGIRLIAMKARRSLEDGDDLREDGLDIIVRICEDIGEVLTEEVT